MVFHINSNYAPNTAGGCCIFCGDPKRSDQVFALNSDVQLPGLGRLSICDRCSLDIGQLAGLQEPTEPIDESVELEELRYELNTALVTLATIKAVLDNAVE